jgi:hypothetical protein
MAVRSVMFDIRVRKQTPRSLKIAIGLNNRSVMSVTWVLALGYRYHRPLWTQNHSRGYQQFRSTIHILLVLESLPKPANNNAASNPTNIEHDRDSANYCLAQELNALFLGQISPKQFLNKFLTSRQNSPNIRTRKWPSGVLRAQKGSLYAY